MEKFFKLKQHGTDVKTEVVAGLTTFMAMAYILAVNPSILSATGMEAGAIFTATALCSAVATILMALFANLPFALSAGMGLNAYFAYTVVLGMGASWQVALAAVFTEGIIFILLSLTNVREAIFNSIPVSLKTGVSAGIGLFIVIIALINGHVLVDNPSTLVGLLSFSGTLKDGTFSTVGIQAVLCIVGVLITAFLRHKNVKGNILLGIIITWVLGIICEVCKIYVPNPELGFYYIPGVDAAAESAALGSAALLIWRTISFTLPLLAAGFVTALFALFIDSFYSLVVIFACLSILSIMFLRPMFLKNKTSKEQETGMEGKYIGKIVEVIEPIGKFSGAITIYDERWEARCETDEPIPTGEKVKIIKNESLVLTVERI